MPRPPSVRTAALLSAACCALAGCGGAESRTAEEVKRDFAERLVEGMAFGLEGDVKAAGFDPVTYRLAEVRIDNGPDRIYHAEYAEIVVDPITDTVALRLRAVVGADAENGGLVEKRDILTTPVKAGFDITP